MCRNEVEVWRPRYEGGLGSPELGEDPVLDLLQHDAGGHDRGATIVCGSCGSGRGSGRGTSGMIKAAGADKARTPS